MTELWLIFVLCLIAIVLSCCSGWHLMTRLTTNILYPASIYTSWSPDSKYLVIVVRRSSPEEDSGSYAMSRCRFYIMNPENWPTEEPSDTDLSDCASTVPLPDGQSLSISYSQKTAVSPDGHFVAEVSCIREFSSVCVLEEVEIVNQESKAVVFRMISSRDDLLGIPINVLGIINLAVLGGTAFVALFVLRSMSLRSRLTLDTPVNENESSTMR